MNEFKIYLSLINDSDQLNELKEQIKNQVTHSEITWQKRIELYKKVQLINTRIKQLSGDAVQI